MGNKIEICAFNLTLGQRKALHFAKQRDLLEGNLRELGRNAQFILAAEKHARKIYSPEDVITTLTDEDVVLLNQLDALLSDFLDDHQKAVIDTDFSNFIG
jgi:hypothetical protein